MSVLKNDEDKRTGLFLDGVVLACSVFYKHEFSFISKSTKLIF